MHLAYVLDCLLGLKSFCLRDFEKSGLNSNTKNQKKQSLPLITASDKFKFYISDQLKIAAKHPRDDYREFLNLASLMIELDI